MSIITPITDEMIDGSNFISSLGDRQKEYLSGGQENISKFLSIFGVNAIFEGRKIKITDVTLREGDQAPLTSFSKLEKMFVYLMLRELGVDTIEVGFPAGEADFQNLKELFEFFEDDPNTPYISVLGRAVEHDTNKSIEVTSGLKNTRIHTFIATSDAHILDKFCVKGGKQIKSLEQGQEFVLGSIKTYVGKLKEEQNKRIKDGGDMEIEFSPEDATNTKYEFLLKAVRTAIEAGANVINIPDTVGITTPEVYKTMFYLLSEDTKDLREQGYNFRFSSHIHNDKGFASAGTLAAVQGGVEDVEVTQLGTGERTGNTSFVDSVMTFGIDGEVNGGFNIGEKKIWLSWAVSEAIRQILNDNSFSRVPGIGTNAQTDGSGVHTANPKVYGGAKPYKEALGVLTSEEYFSARGGKAFIKSLLTNVGVDVDTLAPEEIIYLVNESAKQAEVQRRVYASNILVSLLKSRGSLSNIDYDIDSKNKTISLSFNLLGKEIKINESFSGENGYIEAIIRGFRKLLGEDFDIELVNYETSEKPSLRKIMSDFSLNVEKIIGNAPDGEKRELSSYFIKKFDELSDIVGNNKHGEESIALTYLKFNINGEERNVVTQSRDTGKGIVDAIVYSFIPSLIKKFNLKF